MKIRNLEKNKVYIIILLFIVTVVITFISMNYEISSPSSTLMTQSKLPVIVMQTENGMQFNRTFGYTCELDNDVAQRKLTPLQKDRRLSLVIYTYGESVKNISYKIRNLSDDSLIENTKVTEYKTDVDKITADLNIKNLIDSNKEYMLNIIISTDEYEEINYYTNIITGEDYNLEDKLTYVLEYNQSVYDPKKLSSISKYLELSSEGRTNNYGNVNIHSTTKLIGFGDLNPFVQSEIIPEVISINNEIAEMRLDYSIGAENSYESYDSYQISEYFKIRQVRSNMYLLDYEREANQVFDARNDLSSSAKIILGITSDKDVVYKESEDCNYIFFVNEGTLWSYKGDNNTFTKIFTFLTDESDNTRESNQKHNIDIINVTSEGNCTFAVNGYMNSGIHEGKMGISLFDYDEGTGVVEERVFIPLNVSYENISEKVGKISYVKDDNRFYILINDSLYSIDLTSKEVMVEIADLQLSSYATSKDRKAIAYTEGSDKNKPDTIRILNIEQGNDYVINAPEGDSLKVIGFINGDCIYGIAHNSDIEEHGGQMFPMYKICILNTSYEEIKTYEENQIYVTDASVSNLRVNLVRAKKDEYGNLKQIEGDQLINKDENATEKHAQIDSIYTENRLQETVITYAGKESLASVTLNSSKEVVFKSNGEVKILK